MKKAAKSTIIQMHKNLFKLNLDYLLERGYNTVDKINRINAKKILEEALWKIPEANGKQKPDFISQGVFEIVKELEVLGYTPNKSSFWTNGALIKHLDSFPTSFSRNPEDYKTQLEHVTPRDTIIRMILASPQDWESIIDKYCVGCLVLKHEHDRLSNVFDPTDLWGRYKTATGGKISVYKSADLSQIV